MTEQDLIEAGLEEGPPSAAPDHPPFRMRERRLVLLPDLRPPTLDELRWASRERRRRKNTPVPEPRQPVRHVEVEEREPADVPTTLVDEPVLPLLADVAAPLDYTLRDHASLVDLLRTEASLDVPVEDVAEPEADAEPEPEADAEPEPEPEPEPASALIDQLVDEPLVAEPLVAEAEAEADSEFFDLHDPEFPQLRPWRPAVLPDAEPDDVVEPDWLSEFQAAATEVVLEPEPEPVLEPEAALEIADLVEPEAPSAPDAETEQPLVSHVMVVREPVADPGRIAVLDEVEYEAPVITRLVPLPTVPLDGLAPVEEMAPVEDLDVASPLYEDELLDEVEESAEGETRTAPLYWRLLRLRYTRPNGWLRALFFEGSVALGVVLVLAEAASVWTIVVLPLVVAVVVKANDVLAGNLRRTYQPKRRAKR